MSSAAADLPSPPPAPVSAPGRLPSADFGDWLSPMLVKELRQGMHTRVFVWSFLLLQVLMIFLSFDGLTSARHGYAAASDSSGAFWSMVSLPLLVLLPLAALGSIGGEAKADTLELILLTRLTPRRILRGKWIASFAQGLLLVCAVLPYAVLRYFMGSVDLAGELSMLAGLLFLCAILTALGTGVSPLPARLRITAAVGLVFIFMAIMGGVRSAMMFYLMAGGGSIGVTWQNWALLILPGLSLIFFALEFGAGRISPPAEDHSSSLRFISLGTVVAGLLICKWLGLRSLWPPLVVTGLVLLIIAGLLGLSEQAERPPNAYRRFVRFGLPGRLLGRFFYPGWPSAVLFVVLSTLILVVLARWTASDASSAVRKALSMTGFLALGTVLMPFAIVRAVFPRTRFPFLWAAGVVVACLFFFAAESKVSRDEKFRPILMLPPAALIQLLDDSSDPESLHRPEFKGAFIVTGISFAVLMLRAIAPFTAMAAAERRLRAPQPAP